MANMQVKAVVTAEDRASVTISNVSKTLETMGKQAAQSTLAASSLSSKLQASAAANPAIQSIGEKLAIAKQRLLEASQAAGTKKSTMLQLQATVKGYENELVKAAQEQSKLKSGMTDTASAAGRFGSQLAQAGQAIAGMAIGATLRTQLDLAVDASNRLENALIGLGSVANAFGSDANVAQEAAKSLASDGLMSVNDAATSLKNLLSSGFSLDQAIVLVNRFKDTAAFGRQAALGFGEAISSATEGIKNGNSILVDNAGVTKNLSVILEEMGFAQNDVMRASSDASVRMALYNGIIKETIPQLGDAARLSQTFSGAQARLSTAITMARARIGDLAKAGLAPLIQGITDFLSKNQEMAVSLAFAVGAAGAFAAAIVGVAGAIGLAVTIMGGPFTMILAAISALLGVFVFQAMQKVQQQMGKTTNTFSDGSQKIKQAATDGMGKAGKKASELAERLADIDDQMTKTTRNFRESLAEIVKDHQDKVNDLKRQLEDENKQFTEAATGRETDFKQSQIDAVREHERRVADITAQIKQEQIAGTQADQTKLNSLQLRLAQENEDFSRQMASNETKYKEDTAKAVASHEAKKTDFQMKLDEETAFLQKHNADVASIRDVQLLDEIDKLKRSHTEQQAEFEKQKQKAIKSAQDTTAGMAGAFNSLPGQVNAGLMNGIGGSMGTNMANAFKQAFIDTFNSWWKAWGNWVNKVGSTIGQSALDKTLPGQLSGLLKTAGLPGIPGFAGGVQNFQGGLALVGERGPELVNLPRGSNVTSNADLGSMGPNITANVTISGVFMGTPVEARRLAQMVAENLKDIAGAKNQSVMQYMGG